VTGLEKITLANLEAIKRAARELESVVHCDELAPVLELRVFADVLGQVFLWRSRLDDLVQEHMYPTQNRNPNRPLP